MTRLDFDTHKGDSTDGCEKESVRLPLIISDDSVRLVVRVGRCCQVERRDTCGESNTMLDGRVVAAAFNETCWRKMMIWR